MERIEINANCWPTAPQELLLRAALLQGKEAIEAWERWKSSADMERLDDGSLRLLPHLYRNLRDQGVDDPLLSGLKSFYRRTWSDNQLLFHQVSGLITAFRNAGIDTIVLKGAALAILHYKDAGLRPMNDFDLMVRVEQRPVAIELMRGLGWSPVPRLLEGFNEAYLSVVHGHEFTHVNGKECDLHWHLSPEYCQANADDDFWQHSVPFEVHGVPTRSLASTDQLLHVCLHATAWTPTPSLRWVADAMMIMRTSVIDWDRLMRQAEKRQVIVSMRATLTYLYETLSAPVPPEVLQSLRDAPVSKMELAEYDYKTTNYESRFWGFLPVLWFRYLRLEESESLRPRFLGFARYLGRFWGAERLWELPIYAIRMVMRKFRLMVARHTHIKIWTEISDV